MLFRFSVGRLALGRCDRLDGEGVVTEFLLFGPFLWPMGGAYVVGAGPRARRFPVERQLRSIVIAYLRWVVVPLVTLCTYCGLDARADSSMRVTATMSGFGALWMALLFVAGRTRGRGARQRRMLGDFVGHKAPPEVLFSGTQRLVVDALDSLWTAMATREDSYRALAVPVPPWRECYPKDVPATLLPLYYALCRYEAALSGETVPANRARLAWDRIEREEVPLAVRISAVGPALARQ
jgi:hypothetical protein